MIGDERFAFEGEWLVDKVTTRYYVPERWLVKRVNEKLERAAKIAEESTADRAAARIRTLKENL